MKKYDGKHRKKLSRKKRELLFWQRSRAKVLRTSVKRMARFMEITRDPFAP